MIVSDVVSRRIEDAHEIAARVTFENPNAKTERLWVRFPADIEEPPVPGDVFLAASMIPAMILREDLRIDAPVSSELLTAARERLTPVMRRWGWDRARISIRCDEAANPLSRGDSRRTGCFFSGGVDSWYTVRRNLDSISELVYLQGFEIRLDNEPLWRAAVEQNRLAARESGTGLLLVSSNILERVVGEVTERLERLRRPWGYFSTECYFGSMLVGVALALQRRFRRIVVPASWPYEYLVPNGSHLLMEPRWSTEAVEFVLDGCEASRIDKIRALLETSPEALRGLRVCGSNPTTGTNCGRCWKCVRTLLEMRLCGALHLAESFERPLDLDTAKMVRAPVDGFLWPDLLREAVAAGDREVVDVVRIIMGEKLHGPRLRAQLGKLRDRRSRRAARRWLKKRLFGREHVPRRKGVT